jgi:Fic family protein
MQVAALSPAVLIHVQFETIHPFLDGNGRLGRLLITVFFGV